MIYLFAFTMVQPPLSPSLVSLLLTIHLVFHPIYQKVYAVALGFIYYSFVFFFQNMQIQESFSFSSICEIYFQIPYVFVDMSARLILISYTLTKKKEKKERTRRIYHRKANIASNMHVLEHKHQSFLNIDFVFQFSYWKCEFAFFGVHSSRKIHKSNKFLLTL